MREQIISICAICYEQVKDNIKMKRISLPGENKAEKCKTCGKKTYTYCCKIGGKDGT